ncbi:DUF2950 domain-containing protein [Paraburkholderia fungorum]|uniref:DUF2950 domain-containing protein n=1 Tax=Paraburkholderia fungorum TaxID=134537 RepID=A0AAW3V0P3_9BURK|nr:DUF2950 domain-containing protein [Paraburkholderia fungorum]MBB4515299.1 hypothetical protein [Paraburkholderia fungorum]MBB6203242.1 hypothetical protein [Paraburkholderia fungorum]MBU7435927.1 DUF2950 domain-containing protein [Paraburkholderia fungorum]
MIRLFPRGALRAHVRTLAAALGTTGSLLVAPVLLLGTSAAHAQAVYPTADAAASAFVDALARNDEDALKHVLGNDFHRFIPAEGIGEDDIYQFLGAWSKGHQIVEDPVKNKGRATAHLAVGDSGWTLPIPLVQAAHGWRFDPPAAQDEMLTRRIGRNERAAILTSLAYLDAQYDYHNLTQHYAQRFVSTPGQHDGLYWVTAPGETESPLGPLAATMPNGTLPTEAYHGYHYRILTAQGPHAKGGAQNYVENGVLSKGFGLIASPAEYGKTGVMSFIVNQEGQVYQKNLGPQTARAAAAIKSFDPDDSWQPVQP